MFYVQPLIQTKYSLLVLNVRSMFDALLRSPSMKPLPEAVSLISLEAQQQVEAALHVMPCVCVCVCVCVCIHVTRPLFCDSASRCETLPRQSGMKCY